MAQIPKITCRPNGPYLIHGPVDVVDPEGHLVTIDEGKAVALCRCGHSTTKPFCDATHARVSFEAAEPAPLRAE